MVLEKHIECEDFIGERGQKKGGGWKNNRYLRRQMDSRSGRREGEHTEGPRTRTM